MVNRTLKFSIQTPKCSYFSKPVYSNSKYCTTITTNRNLTLWAINKQSQLVPRNTGKATKKFSSKPIFEAHTHTHQVKDSPPLIYSLSVYAAAKGCQDCASVYS